MLRDGLTVQDGRAAGAALAKRARPQRPDGVFCANDLLAVGVLQSFTMTARLDIPGDMALVGYDDIDFASASDRAAHLDPAARPADRPDGG